MSSLSMKPRRSSTSSTIKPTPPEDPALSPIENSIALTALSELGPNIFTNTRPLWQPAGARGIYGGAVIAQSLHAAQLTVPPQFAAHSMHCYFVLAGNPSTPVIYYVDIVREGRSFHTRTVQARQLGRCIFTTTISFTVSPDEEKRVVAHQIRIPDTLPPPEDCENELMAVDRLLKAGRIDEETAELGRARYHRDPFEWRRIHTDEVNAGLEDQPAKKVMRSWVRSKSPIVDPKMQDPALAYFSDSWFIGTVGRVNPAARRDRIGMMVSLDHTIHFHVGGRTKVDEWLLVENKSPWSGEERGLAYQRIWDMKSGVLMASCEQEGMVRLKDGREGDQAESKL